MTFEEAHQNNLLELDRAWGEVRKAAADIEWINQNDDYLRKVHDLDEALGVIFRFKNAWADVRRQTERKARAAAKG